MTFGTEAIGDGDAWRITGAGHPHVDMQFSGELIKS
jgi:hypothetical protein